MRDCVAPRGYRAPRPPPMHPAEQSLHAIRGRVPNGLRQLPAVLALHRTQQAMQIRDNTRRGSPRPNRSASRVATVFTSCAQTRASNMLVMTGLLLAYIGSKHACSTRLQACPSVCRRLGRSAGQVADRRNLVRGFRARHHVEPESQSHSGAADGNKRPLRHYGFARDRRFYRPWCL